MHAEGGELSGAVRGAKRCIRQWQPVMSVEVSLLCADERNATAAAARRRGCEEEEERALLDGKSAGFK